MKPQLTKSKSRQLLKLVKQSLECKICFDIIRGPVWQCKEGHIVCSKCKKNCNQVCAFCRLTVQSRNRVLEELFSNYKISCPNKLCNFCSFNDETMNNHLLNCKYNPIKCLCCSDYLEPKLSTIVQHFEHKHKCSFATVRTMEGTYKNPHPCVEQMKCDLTMDCPVIDGQINYTLTYFVLNYQYHANDDRNNKKITWTPRLIRMKDEIFLLDVDLSEKGVSATLYELSTADEKSKYHIFFTCTTSECITMSKITFLPRINHDHQKRPIIHHLMDKSHTRDFEDKKRFGFKIYFTEHTDPHTK
jgi:hypothetical protein